jgi:hypothetical protein
VVVVAAMLLGALGALEVPLLHLLNQQILALPLRRVVQLALVLVAPQLPLVVLVLVLVAQLVLPPLQPRPPK